MGRRSVTTESALPSLIIPCPRCAKRMSFRSARTTKAEPRILDTTYACDQCGAEVICTSFCRHDAAQAA